MDIDPDVLANLKIAGSAAAGGLVRLRLRPSKSLGHDVTQLFACVTCGFFGTIPVVDWLSLASEYVGAVGALLGLLGLSCAEGALKAADKFDLVGWLSSRGGWGK